VGTLEGLVQVDTASAYLLQTVADVPGQTVQALVADRFESLWVGTPAGLSVLNPRTGRIYRVVDSLRGRNITSLRFDTERDRLWVGSDSGVFLLNPYNGAIEDQILDLPSSDVMALAPNTGNKLWIGTREGLAWVGWGRNQARSHFTLGPR